MSLLFLRFLPDVVICQIVWMARLPPNECARLFSSPNERSERAGEKRERTGESVSVREGLKRKESRRLFKTNIKVPPVVS